MASRVTPEAAGADGVAANVPKESHELRRAVGVWGSYTWGYADVGADVYVALGIVMAAAQGATNVAFLFAGLVYVMVGIARISNANVVFSMQPKMRAYYQSARR